MLKQPNVIFILTDDQGTLDANCYGANHLTHARWLAEVRPRYDADVDVEKDKE